MKSQDNIGDRLIDAEVLLKRGRKNGAFILALIALAGLSRQRYPKDTSSRTYYDKLREYHPNQTVQIAAMEKAEKAKRVERAKRRKKNRAPEFGDRKAFECMVLDLLARKTHHRSQLPLPGHYADDDTGDQEDQWFD